MKEKKEETYFLMSCLAFVPFSVVSDIFPKAYRYVATQKHFSSRAIRKKKSIENMKDIIFFLLSKP